MFLEQPGHQEPVLSPPGLPGLAQLGLARSLLAPAQNQALHTRTPVSLRLYSGWG